MAQNFRPDPEPSSLYIRSHHMWRRKSNIEAKIASVTGPLDLLLPSLNSVVFRVVGLFLRSKCVQRISETRGQNSGGYRWRWLASQWRCWRMAAGMIYVRHGRRSDLKTLLKRIDDPDKNYCRQRARFYIFMHFLRPFLLSQSWI